MHVWGTGAAALPFDGKRNMQHGIELYRAKRFIALGRSDAIGKVVTDCTAALASIVATYFSNDSEATGQGEIVWTSAPCDEWDGYAEDGELIQAALDARPTAGAMFDNGVTFRDLWEANADALGKKWPHAENGYDRSSADASLTQRLAFRTGNDCERIKRLMLHGGSALYREKWEREDYLQGTILKAVSQQAKVYNRTFHHKPHDADPANAGDLAAGSVIAPSVEHKVFCGRKDHNACFSALAAMQIEVRANLRKRGRMEVTDAGRGWSEFSDRHVTDLRDRIADQYWYTVADNETMNAAMKPLKFSITQFNEHLLTTSKRNEVDPFKQWLETLPAWDGTARLDNWITRLFDVDGDPHLMVWTSRYLFLGAVQRTYEPGCKLDETPVLIGDQGIGKSAVLKACLPNDKAAGLIELFTDGCTLPHFQRNAPKRWRAA